MATIFTAVAPATAQGTSTQLAAHAALNKPVRGARLYCRLCQINVVDTVAFSSVVAVVSTDKSVELTLSPNPSTARVIVTLPAAKTRRFLKND